MYTQPVSTTSVPFAVKNVNELEPEYNLNVLQKCIIDDTITEEIAKELLSNGIDVNHQDVDGYTALQYAICDELYDLAKLLINHGANPAIIDKNNQTAFDELKNIANPNPEKAAQREELRQLMTPLTLCKAAIKEIIAKQETSANLSAFQDFDDTDLENLSKNCPHLTHLTLRSLKFSNGMLEKALMSFTNLQSLDIGACLQISTAKLSHPHLENLNLDKCVQIDLRTLNALPHLQTLNLTWWNIFDSDLTKLLEKLPHLQTLILTNCKHISNLAVNAIQKDYPNLTIIK